jgi:hypothetical protein
MSDKVIEPEIEHANDTQVKHVSRFTRWYRSPLFNVIIVGLISFTQPGIWNALNSKLADLIHPVQSLTSHETLEQAASKNPTS